MGVYITVTGSTAREYGLVVGDHLFPSETVLMENVAETDGAAADVKRLLDEATPETAIAPGQ
jgi:ATP phosphoribosyltransferase